MENFYFKIKHRGCCSTTRQRVSFEAESLQDAIAELLRVYGDVEYEVYDPNA